MGDESEAFPRGILQEVLGHTYKHDWGMMEESDYVIPLEIDNSKVVPMTINPIPLKRISVSEEAPNPYKQRVNPFGLRDWEEQVDASDDESIMTQLAGAEEREQFLLKVIHGLVFTIEALGTHSEVSAAVACAYDYIDNEYSQAVFNFIAERTRDEETARIKERERQERLRRDARAKLTKEEREALGLE